MKAKGTFYAIKCDCCGECYDPNNELATIATECGFKHLGGRDYCPDCWERDDDDIIHTKDGRKWDDSGINVVEVTTKMEETEV